MRFAVLAHNHSQSCLQMARISRGRGLCRIVRSFMSAQETSAPPVRQHSLDNSSASPVDGEQLTQVAVRVLTTPNAADKASLTHQTAHLWRDNRLQCSVATDNRPAAPARPARDDAVSIIPDHIL